MAHLSINIFFYGFMFFRHKIVMDTVSDLYDAYGVLNRDLFVFVLFQFRRQTSSVFIYIKRETDWSIHAQPEPLGLET